MRIFLLILFLPIGACLSQTTHTVRFVPVYEGKQISLDQELKDRNGNSIQFSTLRLYISQVFFSDSQGQELTGNQYQLIDLENPQSLAILEHSAGINQIGFLLGIDSLTNVSGILEGPLDPINGMYWTWNSGYINFKLEGRSSLSPDPKKEFEYHLGGYLHPFATSRQVILQLDPTVTENVIEIHLDEWLNAINMSETYSVMIPGEKAVQLSDQLVTVFKVRKNAK